MPGFTLMCHISDGSIVLKVCVVILRWSTVAALHSLFLPRFLPSNNLRPLTSRLPTQFGLWFRHNQAHVRNYLIFYSQSWKGNWGSFGNSLPNTHGRLPLPLKNKLKVIEPFGLRGNFTCGHVSQRSAILSMLMCTIPSDTIETPPPTLLMRRGKHPCTLRL